MGAESLSAAVPLLPLAKQAGQDTFDAELLLYQFERTLTIFEEDYRGIRAELESQREG